MALYVDSGRRKIEPRVSYWHTVQPQTRDGTVRIPTSMIVFSSCQFFVGTGSCSGPPGRGLKVPCSVHFGYSNSSRAHSLRFTSKTSMMLRIADLTA